MSTKGFDRDKFLGLAPKNHPNIISVGKGKSVAEFSNFSLKIKNFKCFSDAPQGFEVIKPMNLIIGRNNSGKSSLLDLIDFTTRAKIEIPENQWHARRSPSLLASSKLTDEDVSRVFQPNHSRGGIPGNNHYEFGKRLIGSQITWDLNGPPGQRFVEIGPTPDGATPFNEVRQDDLIYKNRLAEVVGNPFQNKQFRRIYAERNIVPEADSPGDMKIDGDGHGATYVIQSFINKAELPSDLVERTLLKELNSIVAPDAHFNDIVCQHHKNNTWEIYLEEDTKGRIPLSQSGSGLKTIILVLSFIYLLPAVAKSDLSNFVFAFEELENNLHPSLLRRLLSYLRSISVEHKCTFFLTTHSNVIIDLFSKDKNAQIVHVTHDRTRAVASTVKTYVDNKGILDDLDVRASDLLQSNGIIWVEGPSDRIYLNRWIGLWSDGKLTEGVHYQCVFYGGRLLSHLTSADPDTVEDAVSILRANRNAIVLMDSDMSGPQDSLNETKNRIIEELNTLDGISWVTKGKEVENYVPAEAVAKLLEIDTHSVNQVDQYQSFFDYLDTLKENAGKRYLSKKPLLAEMLVPYMTHENISEVHDLAEKLETLCSTVRRWNNLDNQ